MDGLLPGKKEKRKWREEGSDLILNEVYVRNQLIRIGTGMIDSIRCSIYPYRPYIHRSRQSLGSQLVSPPIPPVPNNATICYH